MRRYAEVTSKACILSGLCDDRIPEGGIPPEDCRGITCN